MKLTSIDYARLVQYAAQKKHRIMLNKTQVNKILFYVYGAYLADTGDKLFDDDFPQAWVFGPVFPRVYKKIDVDEIIKTFPKEHIDAFNANTIALNIISESVAKMSKMSASSLTAWSHEDGSPWYDTIYECNEDGELIEQKAWSTRIEDDKIKEYFSNKLNRVFDGWNKSN